MERKLSKVLDNCLSRLREGGTIESCLAEYPALRTDLEPLLCTAVSVSAVPRAAASQVFRKESKIRLVYRVRQLSASNRERRPAFSFSGLTLRRVAVPLALVVFLALGAILFLSGAPIFSPQPATLGSQCTLSIMGGSVSIQSPEADGWQVGSNGMTLKAGTIVKTGEDSQVVLTFLEGTTIELEPGTSLQIQELRYGDDQSTVVVLRQWAGRTWSRVTRMTDGDSLYEIRTPSAHAVVRGTLFFTEVDESGATTVQTLEGLVSVMAKGVEVDVGAGYWTRVEAGMQPGVPVRIRYLIGGGSGDAPLVVR